MSKRKQGGQPRRANLTVRTVEITPTALTADAYVISRTLTEDERREFNLKWAKMNKEAGTNKVALFVTEDLAFESMATGHLKIMRESINAILKERGEE